MKPPLSEHELLLELHPESLRSDCFRAMFLESSPLLGSPRLSDRTSVFQGSGCVDAAPFWKQVREESYPLLPRRLLFTWRDGGGGRGQGRRGGQVLRSLSALHMCFSHHCAAVTRPLHRTTAARCRRTAPAGISRGSGRGSSRKGWDCRLEAEAVSTS